MAGQSILSQCIVRDAIARIGDHEHCQAGGTIGLSAALAAALAQATANGTLATKPTAGQAEAARRLQATMADARTEFLGLADRDANALLEFVVLEERGEVLRGYALLCDGPRVMADLAITCAEAMEAFRVDVDEHARDDLEFALTLMVGAAHAAMQLLDSNLRIWPLPDLLAAFDPHVTRLVGAIAHLTPTTRIR